MAEKLRKFDSDKPKPSYIEPGYILGTAKVLTFGGNMYGFDNWKNAKPEDIRRYKDALMRHMLAYFDGEIIDPESGEPHIYHMSCNLMFLNYFDGKET